MKLITLSGKEIYRSGFKYKVNWDKKERSQFQTNVKNFLKPYLFSHWVFCEFPCYGTRLKIDIFDATTKIAYEINGDHHREYNPFFMNKSRSKYLRCLRNDGLKIKWCEINKIKLIEIYKEDVLSREFFIERFQIYL